MQDVGQIFEDIVISLYLSSLFEPFNKVRFGLIPQFVVHKF